MNGNPKIYEVELGRLQKGDEFDFKDCKGCIVVNPAPPSVGAVMIKRPIKDLWRKETIVNVTPEMMAKIVAREKPE